MSVKIACFLLLACRLLGYEGMEVINPDGGKDDAEEEANKGRWKQEVCLVFSFLFFLSRLEAVPVKLFLYLRIHFNFGIKLNKNFVNLNYGTTSKLVCLECTSDLPQHDFISKKQVFPHKV